VVDDDVVDDDVLDDVLVDDDVLDEVDDVVGGVPQLSTWFQVPVGPSCRKVVVQIHPR
jgi:hypothetical protein